MSVQEFIKYLLVSTLASIGVFFLTNFFLPLIGYLDLLWWSLLCYSSLAIIIFCLIERSMRKSGGKTVIALVILNVLLKLIFSFGFVALYVEKNQPQDRIFIIPFLTTYLVFTIFETWFLNRQAGGVKA